MTYIILGNYDNINFMAVDCIATGENRTFEEKLFKLYSSVSPDTYVTLSGIGGMMFAITYYDSWHYEIGETVNYENEDIIREILSYINSNDLPERSRIFFLIGTTKAFYYDIVKRADDFEITLNNLIRNTFVICSRGPEEINHEIPDLFEFCKRNIISYNEFLAHGSDIHTNLDFKNRFSLIYTENNQKIHIRPFRDLNDFMNLSLNLDSRARNWNNVIPLEI